MAWVALCLSLGLLIAASARGQPTGPVVSDDRGVTVRFATPPRRVVTLLPSLTETVCELGACDRLVGTDRYSNFPASVRTLPKLGGLDNANLELIVSLRPDVVLLSPAARITDRLEALGLKVVALETRSYEDVQRVLGTVSQLLSTGDPAHLWQRIDAAVDDAARSVPSAARGLSVYFEVDSAPYAAGESSFIGQTLKRLGLRNVVPASLGPFPKLNPEFIVRADPQVIMIAQRNGAALAARPGWEGVSALRHQRVCRFNHEDGDVLTRPGPRLAQGAQVMARCLRDVVSKATP